jgi:hypothetical protein
LIDGAPVDADAAAATPRRFAATRLFRAAAMPPRYAAAAMPSPSAITPFRRHTPTRFDAATPPLILRRFSSPLHFQRCLLILTLAADIADKDDFFADDAIFAIFTPPLPPLMLIRAATPCRRRHFRRRH